ncbi:6-phosphogluconolactonase [Pandoraea horticolens]|uniref:6-phosphogluconolactonase n=1 Tax=Pandoraea horticolens TaxID=2508298 RepID=A0A5E4WFV9_9BURK|nr:beta-propeller fold lactonase family protein [Pandoraea horticolens]VVE23538.1 6-phosphogluconolactonase [Pandoraea horticolens]
MKKIAYVLEYGVIHPYSVQPDGSLSPLGNPVSCANAVGIACPNVSKFSPKGDYLFVVSESADQSEKTGAISIYHVESDGSLTPKIDHYTNGVSDDPSYVIGFYVGSSLYYLYIDNFLIENPLTEQIPGFRFLSSQASPEALTPWTKNIQGLPDTVIGDIATLELVPTPGATPSYQAQFVLAIYQDTPAKKSQIVALSTNAFGLAYRGSGEINSANIDSDNEGNSLAADPNGKFVYVILDSMPTSAPNPLQVVGFKLENGGQQFIPLGNVAHLPGSGNAGVVSQNGKYLFVAVAADILTNQGENVVISYKIGVDGLLTKSDQKPCGFLGDNTVTLVIEPSGRYLYALSEFGGTIQVYEINDDDGSLTTKLTISVDTQVNSVLIDMVVIDM